MKYIVYFLHTMQKVGEFEAKTKAEAVKAARKKLLRDYKSEALFAELA